MQGYDIKMNSVTAVTRLINILGTGIPMSLALRELVVNGLEACLRNSFETKKCVYVIKDHTYTNKLSVVNVGGDFLSEEIFKKHLATLGNTGNSFAEGQTILDDNKGIGAKVAYLPQAKDGLLYRSLEAGEDLGITAQMCQDPESNIYTVRAQHCPHSHSDTAFPFHEEFSPLVEEHGGTGTEVVCMGNFADEDTWTKFDHICSKGTRKDSGGTGYGILRYLSQRFWLKPAVPVKVAMYIEATGEYKYLHSVEGLQNVLEEKAKLYGVVPLQVNGLNVKAHWAVLHDAREYRSHVVSDGFTAFAWKGETYFDFNQSSYSKKKDIKDCGVVVKSNRAIIVFEFEDEVSLCSNAGRTELVHNNAKLDKALFHNEFQKNMPKELLDWQDENQESSPDDEDIEKWVKRQLKKYFFEDSEDSASPVKTTVTGEPSDDPEPVDPPEPDPDKKPRSTSLRMAAMGKLRSLRPPTFRFINEPEEPLVEFHFNSYEIVINIGSDVFKHREENVLKMFGLTCHAKEYVEQELKQHILLQVMCRIIEIQRSRAKITLEEKQSYWEPKCLEGCWGWMNEREIFNKVKPRHEKMIVLSNAA